jgi:hypothetical protein
LIKLSALPFAILFVLHSGYVIVFIVVGRGRGQWHAKSKQGERRVGFLLSSIQLLRLTS